VIDLFQVTIQERADAHLALRKILSGYLDQAPEKIQFEITQAGKPLHPEIHFSLSHSKNLAMIAVSKDIPIGIDIEHVRPVPNKLLIAKRFFSAIEYDYLMRQTPELQEKAFFEIWTAKEALTKVKGRRLMDELSLEVAWDQVVPIANLEGFVGHLASQDRLDPLEPLHASNFIR
jgi:phosphopantetheinyl transferase